MGELSKGDPSSRCKTEDPTCGKVLLEGLNGTFEELKASDAWKCAPVVRFHDGATIAASLSAFTESGAVNLPKHSDGGDVSKAVWTGQDKDCDGWTSANATTTGSIGNPKSTTEVWKNNLVPAFCSQEHLLYCICS